jgi:DNA-binding NarL/FixJ family response regulator
MMNILEKRKAFHMIKLTERELSVIKLISEGKKNKEIAKELYLSVHTIKAILEKIYNKTGIHNRVLLALYAYQESFIK